MHITLIHGGLYEGMTADRFWNVPGVVAALAARGHTVAAPDRHPAPESWSEEALFLRTGIDSPTALMAGSNGCSVAVRLALEFPELVTGLLLCWPATCGDAAVDSRARQALSAKGVAASAVELLLSGEVLRGCTGDELASLRMPVAIIPSAPHNPAHAVETVTELRALIPHAEIAGAFPEPPRPGFAPRLLEFGAEVHRILAAWRKEPPTATA